MEEIYNNPKFNKPTPNSDLSFIVNDSFTAPSREHTNSLLSSDELAKDRKVFLGRITLNHNITSVNFYTSWAFVLYLGMIGITYSTLEPQYLASVFGITNDNMGETTAWLYLVDYSVRLLFALVYGPMIDHYGRKTVMTIGIILIGAGYILIPICSVSLFPGYIFAKSITSCGAIALQMLPLAADYVDDSTKGVMAAMNFGIAFVGGGIGAVFLKILSWCHLEYNMICWILGVTIFTIGFSIRFGVKGGNKYYRRSCLEGAEIEITDSKLKWQEVKRAFTEIPWVSIGDIFGVLGNADFYILTTGLVVWIRSLVVPGQDPLIVASTYQIIFAVMALILISTLVFEIDKVSHMKLILPILIVATSGFILVPFVKSATSPLLYIFWAIEGASLPGIFVFSAYLSYRYNPPEIRGTLSGIGNGIGFLGAIIILSIGGYLHDHWRVDASFLLYAFLMLFSLIAVTVIYKTMTKSSKEKKNVLAQQEGVTA